MKKLVIVGTGAMARDVVAFVKRYDLYEIEAFACNQEYVEDAKKQWPDYSVYAMDELKNLYDKSEVELFVAISHFQHLNKVRKETFLKLKKEGFHFATLISPSAQCFGERIGQGCWIRDNAYIGNESVLEENVILSEFVYVAHYCHVKSHVYLAGNSMLMGSVNVGEQCFIGGRSTVFNDVTIGDKCLIGGATVVKRDVERCSVCKLNDITTITKTYPENEIENKLLTPDEIKKIRMRNKNK